MSSVDIGSLIPKILGFVNLQLVGFFCAVQLFLFLLNLDCFIILLWLEGNVSSPIRYSYLSILSCDNADIFAASQLILYCIVLLYCCFSSLIFSSIDMIAFYILYKGLHLKRERLSDARVESLTQKE